MQAPLNQPLATPSVLQTAQPLLKRAIGIAWLAYFLATIVLIGASAFAVATPLMLLGRRFGTPRRLGEGIFIRGLKLLLASQPWLAPRVAITPRHGPGGTLYVSNHRSHLDVFVLLATIRGIRILSKRALAQLPPLAAPMWLTRQIFVRQNDPADFARAMRRIEEALRQGESVHVFPEYHRCPPGFSGTQKFSVAPFQAARTAGATIVPIVFTGTDQAWPKGGLALQPGAPVRARSLPPLDPTRHESARATMEAVRAAIDAAMVADP